MIPEKRKIPDVFYTFTDDGVELPVFDVTNPLFVETAGEKELKRLSEDFVHFQKMPLFFRRFLARRSVAMRAMRSADKGFLSGMATYVAKLPPEALGKGYAGLVDRKVARGIGSVSFRLRLHEMARSIGDELMRALSTAREHASIHLVNIGGGPAMDSLNALLRLQREQPLLLSSRKIGIHVFDLVETGPRFGLRALAVLTGNGGPLHGLDISFDHATYDWNRSDNLPKALSGFDEVDIVICSSEGALFEYGSDEAIVRNLKVLRQISPTPSAVVGSIVRDSELSRAVGKMSTLSFRTLDPNGFRMLGEDAGWTLQGVVEGNPLYRVVTLRKT